MTWHFDAPNGDVYDHTGSLVGNLIDDYDWNQAWSGDFPDEVFSVMDEQAVEAFQSGDTMYVLQTLRHAAFEMIEEGTP